MGKIKASMVLVVAVVAMALGTSAIANQPGDLDPTFGNGGKAVISDLLEWKSYPRRTVIQPDGKILIMGINFAYGDLENYFLYRLNADGSLDQSFGTGGMVFNPVLGPSFEFFGYGLAVSGGKILVSGSVRDLPSNDFTFALFRFNYNGSRDTTFGTNGVVKVPFNGMNASGMALRTQPDGKIVAFGMLESCSEDCYSEGVVILRFHPNGQPDQSFGMNGMLSITNPELAWASDLTILPNGKLLALGYRLDYVNLYLARINADGTLDGAFGIGGITVLGLENGLLNFAYNTIAVQSDGKIVFPVTNRTPVTGVAQSTTIVRLMTDGTFDTSFGSNGKVVIPAADGSFFESVVVQRNGQILAGYSSNEEQENGVNQFALVRLNSDGSRDTGFGANGILTTQVLARSNFIFDMTLQPNGDLIAVGGVQAINLGALDVGVVRYDLESQATSFDFDGDDRSDISVFRPSDGGWYLNRSSAGFGAVHFGVLTDQLTPADYDGDGKADIAVFRNGTWYWLNSSNGTFGARQWGIAGDLPLPADYTGDGGDDLTVYRDGTWWTLNSATSDIGSVQFGLADDKPVPADYDGDGRIDQAVFRDGVWHLNRSTQGYTAVQFGLATDRPVVADYDGDAKADPAVYRDGMWYVLGSSVGFMEFQFGLAADIPAPADYDGDGRTDAAVFRNGVWYLRQTTSGFYVVNFGSSGDKPVPAAFVP